MKITKYTLCLAFALCLTLVLASCSSGPLATLKSPSGSLTVTKVDLTDRWPVGCDIANASCTKFNSNNLVVWYTPQNVTAADFGSAYVVDSTGKTFNMSGNGLDAGVQFISFIVGDSTGFTLHWLDNSPVSLGK